MKLLAVQTIELRGDLRQGGKVSVPRKREKLVLVLKLSVGDVSGERLADLLNNSDLVQAVKAENRHGEIRRNHWAPFGSPLRVSFRASLPKGHRAMFSLQDPNGEGPV